jgi:tol-pal system protein YbgF
MYRCGLSLVYARRYNEAIQVLQNFLRSYPQSSLADNALYWTGECYYAQKQYHTALSYFQRVLFQYPRGNKVPDATLKIALSHFSLKQYGEGCRVLNELISCYPNSEPARKAYRWLDRCGGGYYDPYPGNYGGYDSPYYGNLSLPHYGEPQLPPTSGDLTLPKNW